MCSANVNALIDDEHNNLSLSTEMEAELQLGPLNDSIGYQLRCAQLRSYQGFLTQLAHLNITPGQLGMLIKIKHNAGISQTALARANGIERSTLGEVIDRFEKRGLVERRKHETDRRAYALHLSKQGEDFLATALPRLAAHEANTTKFLSAQERETLLQLLIKLAM